MTDSFRSWPWRRRSKSTETNRNRRLSHGHLSFYEGGSAFRVLATTALNMQHQADEFFRLREPYKELSDPSEFWRAASGSKRSEVKNLLYRPDKLESLEPPKKWVIRNKVFTNISFSKTVISQIEFTDCCFESCLFIGSVISECRFNTCHFISCNFYRSQFQNCYVDPRAFAQCLNPKRHANIGVGLYQELLNNSRQQAQPDFTSDAQYQFLRWKRYLKWDEVANSNAGLWKKISKIVAIFPSWLFELTTGSGMRLRNFALTSSVLLSGITGLNYFFRSDFGLNLGAGPVQNLTDAFYFSTIVVTSLGFGDITPGTDLGRIVVAFEAIVGFLTFALLVSMAFRKITN